MPGLPTGTVTFLFTDIEGSTTLLQRLGDLGYAKVLAEHQRLLRDAFANGNGHEIDTQGDAFLVVFPRARDAVATAVAAQQALAKYPWPDGALLRVRMGLHTGEPLISNETSYVGVDVHRAHASAPPRMVVRFSSRTRSLLWFRRTCQARQACAISGSIGSRIWLIRTACSRF